MNPNSVVAHLEAAVDRRTLGLRTYPLGRVHLPTLLRRLGELQEARSDAEAALRYCRRLLDLWSDAEPELQDDVTAVHRAAARLSGTELDRVSR